MQAVRKMFTPNRLTPCTRCGLPWRSAIHVNGECLNRGHRPCLDPVVTKKHLADHPDCRASLSGGGDYSMIWHHGDCPERPGNQWDAVNEVERRECVCEFFMRWPALHGRRPSGCLGCGGSRPASTSDEEPIGPFRQGGVIGSPQSVLRYRDEYQALRFNPSARYGH